MATDVERLIVSLEASTAKYERALNKANGVTEQRVKAMQSKFDGLGSGIKRVEGGIVSSMNAIGRAAGLVGLALGTQSLINMTSAWTDLNSRVANAVGSVEKTTAVMDRLVSVANRTYSSLEQTAEGYLQNAQALTAMGYSTQQQLDLTETLNNSLVISATRGDKARSVMDAWSKAMAGGKLTGDNLNTIMQSGGRLSKALADSMGISVNELRKWGSEGKITTDVMYGVTSQLSAVRDEAEKMPATIQDGVTKLSTALLRFVGEADQVTGTSASIATAMEQLAEAINNMPKDNWFTDFMKSADEFGNKSLAGTQREIEGISTAVEYLNRVGARDVLKDVWDNLSGANAQRAKEAIWGVEDALRDVAIAAANSVPGEAGEKMVALAGEFLHGKKTAEDTKAALLDIGKANPDLQPIIGRLWTLVDTLAAVYSGAMDAAAAMEAVPAGLGEPVNSRGSVGAAMRRQAGRKALEDDGKPGGPILPPGTGSGSKKQSPTEKFQDDLDSYARKIEMLKQETALQGALNPLINDYGFAKARLTAQQELENAAKKAGLELGPEQQAQIAALAEGYAAATAEAAQLAEAQGKIKEAYDELAQAGRAALDTLIDGFLEGKDAGEVLNNVVQDLLKSLVKMGINALTGGIGGGIMKVFGFAKGGVAANGRPQPLRQFAKGGVSRTAAIFGEAGPEAAVPLPDGRRIPVDLRMPAVPQAGPSAPPKLTVHVSMDSDLLTAVVRDEAGRVVATAAPTIVGASVVRANEGAPAAVQSRHARFG